MADLISVKFERSGVFVEGRVDSVKIRSLLKDAIDDIADAIELQAQREAPKRSGELKAHPVDRDETVIGILTGVHAIGGGFSIRGAGGRFVRGVSSVSGKGELIARSVITVAKEPEHAKWVHDGTGIHGPYKTPIVPRTARFLKFRGYDNKIHVLPSVRGQAPQPFLRDAYLLVNRTFVPVRINQLRSEIKLIS